MITLLIVAVMLQALLSLAVHHYLCGKVKDGQVVLGLNPTSLGMLAMYYTLTVSIGMLLIKTIMESISTKHEVLPVLPTLAIFLLFVLLAFVPLVTMGLLLTKGVNQSLTLTDYHYAVWSHYIISAFVQCLMMYLFWIRTGYELRSVTKLFSHGL